MLPHGDYMVDWMICRGGNPSHHELATLNLLLTVREEYQSFLAKVTGNWGQRHDVSVTKGTSRSPSARLCVLSLLGLHGVIVMACTCTYSERGCVCQCIQPLSCHIMIGALQL